MPLLDGIVQDLRFVASTLRKAPPFALAVVATLTLGIGTNVAIFSVVDAVLLKPLAAPDPDRIVQFVIETCTGLLFDFGGPGGFDHSRIFGFRIVQARQEFGRHISPLVEGQREGFAQDLLRS